MRNWNVQQNLVDSVVANRTNLVKEVEGFVVAMNDYEQDKYLNSLATTLLESGTNFTTFLTTETRINIIPRCVQ